MNDFFAIVGAFLAIGAVLVAIAFGLLLSAGLAMLVVKLCTKKGRASLKNAGRKP